MSSDLLILGVETSCDDTAAAIFSTRGLLSSVISSQLEHAAYGGVVPELASRSHLRNIVPVVDRALTKAGVDKKKLSGVAVTYGPGLSGSLLVGLNYAKALALGLDIPLIGIDHLEGHIYSLFLEDPVPEFPFLCLIASGGHTQLMRVDEDLSFTVLGKTRDDAAGEAFDKVAKLMGLSYPGGPEIERLARDGDPSFHQFPRTRLAGYDYSFSGIKTSVLYYLNEMSDDERKTFLATHLNDLCASFQAAVVDMLAQPVKAAMKKTRISRLALVGGVSANSCLRLRLESLASDFGGQFSCPDIRFSMDNAAMIAVAGYHKLQEGFSSPLTLTAVPSLSSR